MDQPISNTSAFIFKKPDHASGSDPVLKYSHQPCRGLSHDGAKRREGRFATHSGPRPASMDLQSCHEVIVAHMAYSLLRVKRRVYAGPRRAATKFPPSPSRPSGHGAMMVPSAPAPASARRGRPAVERSPSGTIALARNGLTARGPGGCARQAAPTADYSPSLRSPWLAVIGRS